VEALAVVAEQGQACRVGSKPGEFIAVSSTPHPTNGGVPAAGDARLGATVLVFRATAFYTPREVRVKAGEKVVWLYADGSREPHTVTSGTCRGTDCAGSGLSFASGPILLRPGDRFEHTFLRPGSYPYHCDFHTATMQGTVIVRP
jgi:plastocyanin